MTVWPSGVWGLLATLLRGGVCNMQRYADCAPTGFDAKGLNADTLNIGNFVIVLSRNRDSKLLDESNWDTALRLLGGESDTVQVHRFGHWACGWFELLLVDPDSPSFAIAEGIESSLADYPILDESDYSDRTYTAACEAWERASIRDRLDVIHRYGRGQSIFAARRSELPEHMSGEEIDYLAGEI